jgi:tRNA modification GTPase
MAARDDTIAAIATPPGRGGIGVIRVSGQQMAGFARALTGQAPRPRCATLCSFMSANGEALDRGILLYFPAPRSFTGEDVLELQGHGGPVVMQLLLARCVELGARLANPGEFSQRAFLNDKLDLVQAEAVADLIEAETAAAARSAMRSLAGDFSREVRGLVDRLIDLRMRVEAALDFPEEEIDVLREGDVAARLEALRSDLGALINRARAGSMLRSGLRVVLAGLPNVGKSSLLNRLAGDDRAIVTDIPGTTRDVLRETIQVEGIPIHVIDTAGLRDSDDPVERIGVERAWREIERADLVLQLVDACSGETEGDRDIVAGLPGNVSRIVVENKCDLAGRPIGRLERNGLVYLSLSAKTGEGVELLHRELLKVAGWEGHGEDVVLARERHIEALTMAFEKSALAVRRLGEIELCAEELRLAQEALSRITGEFTSDDLLGEIFTRFCIGK